MKQFESLIAVNAKTPTEPGAIWHVDSEAVTRCKAPQVPLRAMGSLIPALAVV